MNVTSQLEAVTVYASGAVCTRRAKIAAPAQPTRQIRIAGLPLSLRATSLRARVLTGSTELRVLDVRAGFDVQLAEEVDVPVEQKALEAAEAELSRLEQVMARLVQEAQDIGSLRPTFPQLKKSDPPRTAPVEAMLQLADFVDRELAARTTKIRALEQQVADARNELQLRRRRLAEASSGKRTERSQLSRSAVVMLSADQTQPLELAIEYQVPGARWVPNYELRLDKAMGGGTLKMRASVAQNSGEDWDGVQLSLSTAQLDRRTDLPELRALKIGRSQPPAPKSGWREPPPGLDELFEGYDEAIANGPANAHGNQSPPIPPQGSPAPIVGAATSERAPANELRRMEKAAKSMAKSAPPAPGAPPPPPPRQSMPMSPSASMAMPQLQAAPKGRGGMLSAFGGAIGGAVSRSRSASVPDMAMDEDAPMEAEDGAGLDSGEYPTEMPKDAREEPQAIVPEDALLDYDRLTMPRAHDTSAPRGRLQPASEWDFAFISAVSVQVNVVTMVLARAQQAAVQVDALSLPDHAAPVRETAAAFDYRYECQARVDVPSSGKWSLVPVMTAQVGLSPGYTCVPAVEPKVYRVLKVSNKSAHALLQGPVDVSVGDEFLMTTQFPTVAPKGEEARLGLGVEEALKVARKTQFKETSGGLLGGSTVLPHEIEIEVSNRLPHAAAIEIRERIPVSEDTDVKIEETAVKPPWEKDEKVRDGVQTDGARRWQLSVAAGEKAIVTAQFSIKIPSDKMLVGGNRRV